MADESKAWKYSKGKLAIGALPDMDALAAETYYVDAAGKEPYGDVHYADPGYQADKKKRYPINTPEHIRAAWNYIHKPHNASKYTPAQVASIKRKIISAWKSKIDEKGPPSA
jgi:hypothetical protein